jgi:hypothetical protein
MLQQKDDLHMNGMMLMQAMQRGHNEAVQILHARISSLENEVTALEQVSFEARECAKFWIHVFLLMCGVVRVKVGHCNVYYLR